MVGGLRISSDGGDWRICRKTDNIFERKGLVADPDLQIGGGGGGGGHQDPEKRGGPVFKLKTSWHDTFAKWKMCSAGVI